jgi:hypothetical protein
MRSGSGGGRTQNILEVSGSAVRRGSTGWQLRLTGSRKEGERECGVPRA